MIFSFFVASIRLNLRRMIKPLLLFCCMAFLLLFLGLTAASAGGLIWERGEFSPVGLAVADEDGESQMPQIIERLATMQDISSYIAPVMVSPDEARTMVAEGYVSAAVVFPEGFINSIFSGENLSPLLILNPAQPVEAFALSILDDNAGSMLVNAQKGSYLVQAVYDYIRPAEPDFYRMLMEVDMKYAVWVLSRSELYRSETVSPTGGALSIAQHYLLSFLVFFCFLAPVGVLYPIYSWKLQPGWLLRIRGSGRPMTAYVLAQLICGAAVIFILLFLIFGGLSFAGAVMARLSPEAARLMAGLSPRLSPGSPSILPALLSASLFLSVFAFLCCSTGHIFPAVSLDFLLAAAFMTVSGGFVPAVLLPKALSRLGAYSPLTWMRGALSVIYVPDAGWAGALYCLRLAASAILLLVPVLVYTLLFTGRGTAER
jgi:hypothetical protein